MPSNYEIHHVSSAPLSGGAGRAGFRLHRGVNALGVNSRWMQARVTDYDEPNITNWTKAQRKKRLLDFRKRRFRKRFKRVFKGGVTCATHPVSWGNRAFFKSKALPDLYNFHWMGNFLDWPSVFPSLTEQCPIVWTLHDLNPLQGAWHYAPFEDEISSERRVLDAHACRIKEAALAQVDLSRLVFVGPSRWMVDQCQASAITGRFECVHIPYGIDTEEFAPIETAVAKEALGIDPSQQVIGFIADSVEDPRKGIAGLQQALGALQGVAPPLLLTAGARYESSPFANERNLGSLQGSRQLCLFYAACDLFVCPSLQDNLPNTVLESMACQTPVIAFNVGGLPDMVRRGTSGYLVPNQDIDQLANTIQQALQQPQELVSLGVGARKLITTEFSLELQAQRYIQLYQRLLA